MTVPEETSQSSYEYTFLKWPEFIEFIPRLAWFKYRGTYQHEAWRLKSKILPVLDALLPLVSERRVDPPELAEVISESDDEY